MERKEILEAAEKCVCGDRDKDYGNPERSFAVIANFWTDYFMGKGQKVLITAHDVAAMMVLLKVGRNATGVDKLDNWVDIAGYAACGGELVQDS